MFLTAGGVIKRSIEVYRANIGNFMRYVGLLCAIGIAAFILLLIGLMGIVGIGANDAQDLTAVISSISSPVLIFLIFWSILLLIIVVWFQIAWMRTVSHAVRGQAKISLVEEFKQSRSLIAPTLGSSILVTIIATVPFLLGFTAWVTVQTVSSLGTIAGESVLNGFLGLLTLYGFFHMIYFSIRFSFTNLGVAVDGYGIKESLKKSSELVKGRWWGILGRILASGLVILLPYYILLMLSQIGGFIGMFFILSALVYYVLCLIPLAMIPSQVIYVSAKEFPLHKESVK